MMLMVASLRAHRQFNDDDGGDINIITTMVASLRAHRKFNDDDGGERKPAPINAFGFPFDDDCDINNHDDGDDGGELELASKNKGVPDDGGEPKPT